MRSYWLVTTLVISGCALESEPRATGLEPAPPSQHAETMLAPGVDQVTPLGSLAELEQLALSRHGDLARLRLEQHALEASAAGQKAWPNPRLTYREYLIEVETRVGPQERAFGIEQPIPWPGALDHRSDRAMRQAEGVGYERIERSRQILSHVRALWAEYFYLGRAIEVRRESLELLERLEQAANDRLSAGRGTTSQVLQIQVEKARLENDLRSMVDRVRPLESALRAETGEPVTRSLRFPDRLESRPPHPADPDAIRAAFVSSDAMLARADAEIRVAESDLDLASYEGWPKLGVGIQTVITGNAIQPGVRGSGDDPWIVGVTLEVPLDRRRPRAAKRVARDRLAAAHASRGQLERERLAALDEALFRRADSLRRVDLYTETLIPKGEESLGALEVAYTGGTGDVSDLLDAERVLLEFRLGLARAESDRLSAEARLRAFLGETASTPTEERGSP